MKTSTVRLHPKLLIVIVMYRITGGMSSITPGRIQLTGKREDVLQALLDLLQTLLLGKVERNRLGPERIPPQHPPACIFAGQGGASFQGHARARNCNRM